MSNPKYAPLVRLNTLLKKKQDEIQLLQQHCREIKVQRDRHCAIIGHEVVISREIHDKNWYDCQHCGFSTQHPTEAMLKTLYSFVRTHE